MNKEYTQTEVERSPAFDEFAPRKILAFLRDFLGYLRKKWIWISLISISFGLVGAGLAYLKKPLFKAEITFAIDEDKAQHNRSEFSEFSEQLGLAPIDGGNIFSSINNIHKLLQSRFLIERTLRTEVTVNKKRILLADFFLDSLDYRDKWIKNSAFPSLKINSVKKDSSEVWFENGIISNMYKTLLSKYLKVSSIGKATTLTSIIVETEHPLFSKIFAETLVSEVTNYYISSKTERSRTNLAIIEQRTDSVKRVYMQALYGRASFTDADINLVRESFSVPGEKKQTDVQILKSAYIDLSRNLESARTSLMNNTPIIQILDKPILPLDVVKPGTLKQFVLFTIIGGFLSLLLYSFLFLSKRLKVAQIHESDSEDRIYI